MKHVVACKTNSGRFAVYCDAQQSYVLKSASVVEVEAYFLDIATARARVAVAQLIEAARANAQAPIPVRH